MSFSRFLSLVDEHECARVELLELPVHLLVFLLEHRLHLVRIIRSIFERRVQRLKLLPYLSQKVGRLIHLALLHDEVLLASFRWPCGFLLRLAAGCTGAAAAFGSGAGVRLRRSLLSGAGGRVGAAHFAIYFFRYLLLLKVCTTKKSYNLNQSKAVKKSGKQCTSEDGARARW